MALLNPQIQSQIKEALTDLLRPVQIRLSYNPDGCEMCAETQELVQEIAGLHDLVSVNIVQQHDEGLPQELQAAAMIKVLAQDEQEEWIDYGVAFHGIPSGYELTSLIEAIQLVSTGDSRLNDSTREALASIEDEVDIHVYVTPTCPYCPRAVVLAHQMAIENPRLRAAMVEAMEFPDASQQRGISSVPHSIINNLVDVIGAVPEPQLLVEVQRAVMVA
ncbi:MAG: thioredoxin family protein [Anaerolineales bacterium]|jgi:glutaredoxin-like protein